MNKVRYVAYQGVRKGKVVCSCIDSPFGVIGFSDNCGVANKPNFTTQKRLSAHDISVRVWKQRVKFNYGVVSFRKVIVEG